MRMLRDQTKYYCNSRFVLLLAMVVDIFEDSLIFARRYHYEDETDPTYYPHVQLSRMASFDYAPLVLVVH